MVHDTCHGATMDTPPGVSMEQSMEPSLECPMNVTMNIYYGIPHGRFRFTECAMVHVPWGRPWEMSWHFPWNA